MKTPISVDPILTARVRQAMDEAPYVRPRTFAQAEAAVMGVVVASGLCGLLLGLLQFLAGLLR